MRYQIGNNLIITDRKEHNLDEKILVIEKNGVFSPSHPTTKLCLELIERTFSNIPIHSILDVGCGTGILALSGLKLGASRAVAVDVSKKAVYVARKNAYRNLLEDATEFIIGSINAVKDSFDLIVANLHFPTLISMAIDFKKLLVSGGALIISGFYETEFYHLQKTLSALGFKKGEVLYKHQTCIELPPAGSFTWTGAQFFLSD